MERLFDLVQSFQSRWRLLSIDVVGDIFWHIFKLLPAGEWSNDLHLAFAMSQASLFNFGYDQTLPYKACPSLRELTLNTGWYDAPSVYWVGKETVETLTVAIYKADSDPLDCVEALSQYQRLTTLNLFICRAMAVLDNP